MVNADSIPRYAEPTWDELAYDEQPARGACWNCDHMIEVKLEGKTHCLCIQDRDDVFEVDPDLRGCRDWEQL